MPGGSGLPEEGGPLLRVLGGSVRMKENKGQVSKEQEREIRDEEKKTFRRRLTDYLVITVASVIYAVAVSFFLDPNSLAPGGVTGIAIIFNRITGLETGTWMFMINIPILALGMWKFGWKFILSTLTQRTGLHQTDCVAYRALVVFIVSVILLCLVDKFAVNRVFLFPLDFNCDSLITFVARNNPDSLFSQISFLFHL